MRSARRGAAAGVSGMTTDHLRPVLDNIRDTHLLHQMGEQFATARIPPGIHGTLRLGRLTALQKLRGGVRGIVVGDVIRRLVGRTMAQQLGKAVEDGASPVCPLHKGRDRVRGTRSSGPHRWIPKPRSCRSMGWERTIPSRERRCSRH